MSPTKYSRKVKITKNTQNKHKTHWEKSTQSYRERKQTEKRCFYVLLSNCAVHSEKKTQTNTRASLNVNKLNKQKLSFKKNTHTNNHELNENNADEWQRKHTHKHKQRLFWTLLKEVNKGVSLTKKISLTHSHKQNGSQCFISIREWWIFKNKHTHTNKQNKQKPSSSRERALALTRAALTRERRWEILTLMNKVNKLIKHKIVKVNR